MVIHISLSLAKEAPLNFFATSSLSLIKIGSRVVRVYCEVIELWQLIAGKQRDLTFSLRVSIMELGNY